MPDHQEDMLQSKDGRSFEVPFNGSLGILALGDVGLMMWRKKRQEVIQEELKRRNEQHER